MAGVAEQIVAAVVAAPMVGWDNGSTYDPAVLIPNTGVVHRWGPVPVVSLAFPLCLFPHHFLLFYELSPHM